MELTPINLSVITIVVEEEAATIPLRESPNPITQEQPKGHGRKTKKTDPTTFVRTGGGGEEGVYQSYPKHKQGKGPGLT